MHNIKDQQHKIQTYLHQQIQEHVKQYVPNLLQQLEEQTQPISDSLAVITHQKQNLAALKKEKLESIDKLTSSKEHIHSQNEDLLVLFDFVVEIWKKDGAVLRNLQELITQSGEDFAASIEGLIEQCLNEDSNISLSPSNNFKSICS